MVRIGVLTPHAALGPEAEFAAMAPGRVVARVEVVDSTSAALAHDDPNAIDPDVYGWIARRVPDSAEAVFIGGNGFRAVETIAALKEALGRPVLTANQVLLWRLLTTVHAAFDIVGYGRLFAASTSGASK